MPKIEFWADFDDFFFILKDMIWILRFVEKKSIFAIFDPLLSTKREGDFFRSQIWVIFKTLRLLGGQKYEKSKKWKTRPQTP